jgi:hypothetical protein
MWYVDHKNPSQELATITSSHYVMLRRQTSTLPIRYIFDFVSKTSELLLAAGIVVSTAKNVY